jgi:hypothetical protein
MPTVSAPGPGTPADCCLSGVLVDPTSRCRGTGYGLAVTDAGRPWDFIPMLRTPPSTKTAPGQRGPLAFTRYDLGGDHPPRSPNPQRQFPGPPRGPDHNAEPAAADIPAISADVDSGELSAAQLPQILEMHDASNRNHVGPRSRKQPRGNHDPGPGRYAHHNSMDPPDARAPPRPQTLVSAVGHPEKSDHRRRRCTPAPSGTIWFLIRDFRTIKDEDSLDPVGGRCGHSP